MTKPHLPVLAAAGAAAGVAATLPMSAFMSAAHRRLPASQKDPLPPAKITRRLEEVAGVDDAVPAEAQKPLTFVNHFGYGGLVGALYGVGAARAPAGVATGVAFGLLVWAGSYLGWLPALKLHRSALSEPAPRNALMIAAHVVYGAALGAGVAALVRALRR